ncbi:MAG TPA: 2-oxoglutarate dehydrogenase complex dihydrolipoyllysine-residue succinyltransferase [Chloroflexota bacterium]|nr:2-oxoglutarate dehydrogenase complex dihydrolipoyllysine-residue succinyltransferase [Chloroflexota bacterium]
MSREIRVPALGESIVEATVGKWHKAPGDQVGPDETIVELETEKVTLSVTAPVAGVVEAIQHPEGSVVAVGDVLGTVLERTASTSPPSNADRPTTPEVADTAPSVTGADYSQPSMPPERHAPTSPSVRRLAAEHDIDLDQVSGSGPGGRIVTEDVLRYVQKQAEGPSDDSSQPAEVKSEHVEDDQDSRAVAATPAAAAPGDRSDREERARLSRRRLTIARRLVEAQRTTASLTTFNEIDMSAVMTLRSRQRERILERHGVRLGFMAFFAKATIAALKGFPRLNAEIDGDDVLLKYHYDLGIAVSTDEGLVVPVVRDADQRSIVDIERLIGDLAQRARDGKLTIDELRGGTFTITNGGVFGSLLSTPILNAPQVGILGMHQIQERPIALLGDVVVRPMMYVALTYDHRIVDGREAVQFLVRIKQLIEDPEELLLAG